MSESTSLALVVDSGQTDIRVRALGPDGFAATYPGVRTNAGLLPQLAGVIGAATRESGRTFPVVAIGTSGLTEVDNDPDRLLGLCRDAGVVEVRLAHDSITSYLGALGLGYGVVVAAGTGVVTLGVGPAGVARVDGWGHVMGDAGSGFWIGREALEAVMRAHDGRGPRTALTDVVRDRYPNLERAYIEIQADRDWVRVVAGFARSVAALATSDPVAGEICRAAGSELAQSAVTALARAGLEHDPAPRVALIGGIMKSAVIRDSCEAGIRRVMPSAGIVTPGGDGLAGAELLLAVSHDNALSGAVAIARRAHHG